MTEILNFDDLIGKEFKFYGATEHQLKLDDMIWEVEEDECDGYRSMLGPIERKVSNAIFFKRPIATVKVTGGGNCTVAEAKEAMQIDWMTKAELNEAIPPAYSRYIAEQFERMAASPVEEKPEPMAGEESGG